MKIFFIVPLITHYRETFFRKLIDLNPQHEWIIIDGEKKVDDGRPNFYKDFGFPHKRFEESFRKIGPFSFRDYEGLFDFVKNMKPELVIMPGIVGSKAYREIAKLSKKRDFKLAIWSCLWEHPDVKKSKLRVFKNIILKNYLNTADYQFAYSTFAKNKLISYGFPEDKIAIAYNGIELDGLDVLRMDDSMLNDLKKKLNVLPDEKVFICVGGLGPDKKVQLLLDAILKIKTKVDDAKFKLFIIGNGPEYNALVDFIKLHNLGDQVKMLGRIVDGVDDYFQICNCLIVPGAGGLSLNQAMYWQKACIVSHADGTEEDLIEDGITGFRFEQDSATSLAECIFRFLESDEHLLVELGKKAKQKITLQSNVNQMVQTFSNAINKL